MSNDYIVQRRIKHHQLRRKARRSEIALRRIYKFLRFVFILFIFYSIYRICATNLWYLPSDIYTNKNSTGIEILGNKIVSKEKIINEMKKIKLERKPLYRINPANIAVEIEKLPPVKRVYVRRFWLPARLVVMVEEVTPAITIAPSEEAPSIAAYAIGGEFIPREYLPLSDEYKVTKILSYGTKGDDYNLWKPEKIETLNKLAKLTELYSGENVKYIDLREPHNAYIQLESVKLKLGEIDESAFERIKSIHDILPEIQSYLEKTKYIDLSWKDSKYLKLEEK